MTAGHVRSWVQHSRAAHKLVMPSLFGLYATVAVVVGAAAPAAESNATAAFEQLSSLAGKSQAVGDERRQPAANGHKNNHRSAEQIFDIFSCSCNGHESC